MPQMAERAYEDFQPSSNWVREEGSDTFVVNLPGFKKDQLRVRLDNLGNLNISGERPLQDNKWSRFQNDILIPKSCNESEIKARFSDGVLSIIMPKTITQVSTQDQAIPKQQTPPNQKPEMGQKPEKVNGAVTGEQQRENSQKAAEDARKELDGIDGKHAASEPNKATKVIGSMETQVPVPQKQTSCRFGIGMKFRFKEHRWAIVNVAVAIAAVVALGLFAKYRLQQSAEAES